jgi:hypothetical protein
MPAPDNTGGAEADPLMASRTFTASVPGAVGLLLRAPAADAMIVVSPDAVEASTDPA